MRLVHAAWPSARSIRSCARTSPRDILANRRSDTAGTIVTTSNPSAHRANPNIISRRIDRCTDELAPDDHPRPSDSLNSGSTTVRPPGQASAQPLRRRSNQVVDGPITGTFARNEYGISAGAEVLAVGGVLAGSVIRDHGDVIGTG